MVTTAKPPLSNLTTYQEGRGFPYQEPQRLVPTFDDILSPYDQKPFQLDINGNPIIPPSDNGQGTGLKLPENYQKKNIRVITVDLTNALTDSLISEPGTLLFISAQTGGTAALKVRLDNFANDRMTMPFDRAISGIPFKQFYITAAAQAGISVEITIVQDAPFDRVGLNG